MDSEVCIYMFIHTQRKNDVTIILKEKKDIIMRRGYGRGQTGYRKGEVM